jgi:ATP-dependent 26S proteasome regulatory subunit
VKILKVILAEEDLEPTFDFEELARMTEGYSGSDLKVCIMACVGDRAVEMIAKFNLYSRIFGVFIAYV